MKPRYSWLAPVLAGTLLLGAPTAASSTEEHGEAKEKLSLQGVTAAVQELLDAKADDGTRIVSEKQRYYFNSLPEHAKELTAAAVESEMITVPAHLQKLLSLDLSARKYEAVMQDNCFLCHTDAEYHDPETLFATNGEAVDSPGHMTLKKLVSDVHFRHNLSCSGCHGGDKSEWMGHDHPDSWPEDREARQTDRDWIPEFCSRCHGDAGYMRRFNPGLPTDQLAKYKESQHGKVLLEDGDSRAAQCVSCHGRHGILSVKSPLSKVYPKNIPETCGACHSDRQRMAGFTTADGSPLPTDQLELYRDSVHGKAVLEKGDTGAAVCNDCHGNHSTIPPDVASVAQICRTCHAGNGSLFDGSKHKSVFEEHNWPECGTCHGNHDIAKTTDGMLNSGVDSICANCHGKYARNNPECNATAEYFYDSITEFALAMETYGETAEELARKGLDVDLLDAKLVELGDTLKQARSYIHTFNRSDFGQVDEAGDVILETMSHIVHEAEAEFSIRRNGMLVSIALIGCLVIILYLKLRSLEEREQ